MTTFVWLFVAVTAFAAVAPAAADGTPFARPPDCTMHSETCAVADTISAEVEELALLQAHARLGGAAGRAGVHPQSGTLMHPQVNETLPSLLHSHFRTATRVDPSDQNQTQGNGSPSGMSSAFQVDAPGNKEMAALRLINEVRRKGGYCPGNAFYYKPSLDPLKLDCRLWQAASRHSRDMASANKMAHTLDGGEDPCDRTAAYGLMTCLEAIAAGYESAAKVVEVWAGQSGSCELIMEADMNVASVGYTYAPDSKYVHWWVFNIGKADDIDTGCLA